MCQRTSAAAPWVGMMDKSATEVAKTSVGEDGANADVLLRSASFVERLEHARAQRERVLAERAQNSDTANDLTALSKPWEKTAFGEQGKATPVARPVFRGPVPFEKPPQKDPVPYAVAHSIPVLTPASKPPESTPTQRRKAFVGWRLSAGFVFGTALGLTLTWALPAFLHWASGQGAGDPAPQASVVVPAHVAPVAPVAAGSVEPVQANPTPDSPTAISAHNATATPPIVAAPATLVLTDTPTDSTMVAQSPAPAPLIAFVPPEGLAPNPPPLPPGGSPRLADATPATDAPVRLVALTGPDLPLVSQTLPAAPAILGADEAEIAVASLDLPKPHPNLAALSIHVLTPASAPPDATDALVSTLKDAGYTVTEAAHVAVAVRQSHVRYYHVADAAAAQALAAKVGTKVRDFTTFDPLPPVGVIEVWIAGKTPEPVVKKKKIQKKKPPSAPTQSASEQQQLQDLRDRLLKELQNSTSP